ncbi:gluconate 2-dehydrogenase subunit 3 family protein [Roseateles sp. BYS87W]|uniref:Gluconate 2-dehydrogenase subunit 3 family protein n=1 Tax=Pelomonas baiyunensis TaxID=3299026 RepID=A0ABW7GYP9_9BURK
MHLDRRTTLQWMLAASAALGVEASGGATPARRPGAGYGTDPKLTRSYRAGELWPLSFTPEQRRCAEALCALIIPADAQSPSAAQLQVHLFIDEWISAPYPTQQRDRGVILQGLAWLDAESERRFQQRFDQLHVTQQARIADDICWVAQAKPEFAEAARFFARFRDLTAGGFYTTPEGSRDLGYVGNVPSVTFDGPPAKVLQIVGLS